MNVPAVKVVIFEAEVFSRGLPSFLDYSPAVACSVSSSCLDAGAKAASIHLCNGPLSLLGTNHSDGPVFEVGPPPLIEGLDDTSQHQGFVRLELVR